jgi:DNA-binding NarL/FixJ family response regulator
VVRNGRTHANRVGVQRRGAKPREPEIRIVLADSQPIDRAGMVRLLEAQHDFAVVGESGTVPETIDRCRAQKPAVLVLSLNLSGQEQAASIPAIRAQFPALRILALSERGAGNCLVLNPPARRHLSDDMKRPCALGTDCLELAASQGALGTLRRDADPEALFRAIRPIAAGREHHDAGIARRVLVTIGDGGKRGAPLSARELEVAALIAEGCSNKEISTSLRISTATAKKHVGSVIAKLGLADRLQVGLFLARHPQVFKR